MGAMSPPSTHHRAGSHSKRHSIARPRTARHGSGPNAASISQIADASSSASATTAVADAHDHDGHKHVHAKDVNAAEEGHAPHDHGHEHGENGHSHGEEGGASHGHSHGGHGHSHGSMNMQGVFLHVLGDA